MSIIKIGSNHYGERCYRIFIATGTLWLQEFHVYAYDPSRAVDLVADYCQEHLPGLCADYYEIFDLCDVGETVDEYAEAHNLTCCGNHGVYIDLVKVEEL